MTSQQRAELTFWRNTFVYGHKGSRESYFEARRRDFYDYTTFLPELRAENGQGVDLCCGLVSIFEHTGLTVVAVDALQDEYARICSSSSPVKYLHGDAENLMLPDGYADWLACFNCIDHTPNPSHMVAEIRRVLKPGGRLYFWVNFDRPPLADAHYALWNQALVDEHLQGFHLQRATICWSETWKKYVYYARYLRP